MNQLKTGCHTVGIETPWTLSLGRKTIEKTKHILPNADLVIINGEGTMHDDQAGACLLAQAGILAHRAGKPVVLLNTVWERNRLIENLLPCVSLIYTRESLSAESIRKSGFNATVVPDLSLTSPPEILFPDPPLPSIPGVVLDSVIWDLAMELADFAKSHAFLFYRLSSHPNFWSWSSLIKWALLFKAGSMRKSINRLSICDIAKGEVVITGRFHGVCLAILAQRPFLALPSNTYKIEGLLKDAKLGDGAFVADGVCRKSSESIENTIVDFKSRVLKPEIIYGYRKACLDYLAHARIAAESMFKEIARLKV